MYGMNEQTIEHDNEQIMKVYENINIFKYLTHDISSLICQQKEIIESNQLWTEWFPINVMPLTSKR